MLNEHFKQQASNALDTSTDAMVEVTDEDALGVLIVIMHKYGEYDTCIFSLSGDMSPYIRYSVSTLTDNAGYMVSLRNNNNHVVLFTDNNESGIFVCKNQSDYGRLLNIIRACGFGTQLDPIYRIPANGESITIKQAFNCLWAVAACRVKPVEILCTQFGFPKYKVNASFTDGKRVLTLEVTKFGKKRVIENIMGNTISYEMCCIYHSFFNNKNHLVQVHDADDVKLFTESVVLLRHREKFELLKENGITIHVYKISSASECIHLRLIPIDDTHCIAISIHRPNTDINFEDSWMLCSMVPSGCYHYTTYNFEADFEMLSNSLLGYNITLPDKLLLNFESYIKSTNKRASTYGVIRDVMGIVSRHMTVAQLEELNTEVFNLNNIIHPSK